MKHITRPGAILRWRGKLVKVISICEGERMIGMEYIDKPTCKKCGEPYEEQFDIIENSPLFQECAESVETISE